MKRPGDEAKDTPAFHEVLGSRAKYKEAIEGQNGREYSSLFFLDSSP